jgi:uncharacterized membrane protein
VNRYARIELITAIVSLALAIGAGIYLAYMTFSQNEACYGISNQKIVCQHLTPGSLDAAQAGGRLFVVLSIVLALYAGGVLGAWWQAHTHDPSARSTAYLVLVTCAATVIGVTLPAVTGTGFFFLPSMAVLVIATLIGLVAWLNQRAAQSA